MTSEEDDYCAKNVSIQETKYIEEVGEFISRPTPTNHNHQTGTLYTNTITGVDEKKKKSTEEFIRNTNFCRDLLNAVLDKFEENQDHDLSTSRLYEKHYLVLSWKVKNETIIPVYWELQRMFFQPVLVEKNPRYVNDFNAIQRVWNVFSYECWIHLTRYPIFSIISRIKCSDGFPRIMINVNFWVK